MNEQPNFDETLFIYRKGSKYYKITDGTVQIIRIINIKNVNTYVCMLDELYTSKDDIIPENTFTIDQKELSENYRLLLPNAQLCLTTILDNGVPDVLIAINKIDTNLDAVESTASYINFGDVNIICRQCIYDVFALLRQTASSCFGISVSRKSCPANIRFEDFYKNCVPTGKPQFINFYKQDNISQILGLLKTTKADEVLSDIYRRMEPDFTTKNIVGIVKSLEELVVTNGLMYDINSMFDIIPMPNVTVKYQDNMYVLDKSDESKVEYAIKCRMKDIIIMELNHFVSENDISEDYAYIKIRDSSDRTFIIQYEAVPGFAEELYPDDAKNGMAGLLDKLK